MPLFGKDKEPAPAPAPARTSTSSRGGLFGRRRSSSPELSPAASRSSGGLKNVLHRNHHEDPAITSARERVASAEHAEREADRALGQARVAVREAREHVRRLEAEAAEEARLAKIKQGQAKSLKQSAKGLGRHG